MIEIARPLPTTPDALPDSTGDFSVPDIHTPPSLVDPESLGSITPTDEASLGGDKGRAFYNKIAVEIFDTIQRKRKIELSPQAMEEVTELIYDGEKVEYVKVKDPSPHPYHRIAASNWINVQEQRLHDSEAENVTYISPQSHPHEVMYSYPALKRWRELSLGTGLGIYVLYNALNAKTLGEGIDPEIFTEPLFEGVGGSKVSAYDIIAGKDSEQEAQERLAQHIAFINEPIDDMSRVIFSGSEDAIGVRVRSELAQSIAVKSLWDRDKSKPLVLASLGAGSAIPAIKTILELQKAGFEIGTYHFVDEDPMALAVAMSLIRNHGIDPSIIKLHVEKLRPNPKNFKVKSIEPNSVDFVEAWGLAEYFPDSIASYLLAGAHYLLGDKGNFCFGNMLTNRKQDLYFRKIVKWNPPVRQRTMQEGVDLLRTAMFEEVKVLVPGQNSVYVGYSGRKNAGFTVEAATEHLRQNRKQQKAKRVADAAILASVIQ